MSEFDAEAIDDHLAAPFRVEFYGSIGSTNDRARELAREGESDVAVVAGEQTAGRGRRGRDWRGPEGGIYCSLLLAPDLEPADYPLLTLAAAVATARAVRQAGVAATIKWPNDVLVGDRKLAGILTERVGDRVVVGVGVNALADRGDLPDGGTSLRAEGGTVDRAAFVAVLLEAFDDLRDDPEGILAAWRESADTLGREVRVETPDGTVEGEAIDVERPGTLVVETDDGTVRVTTGDCQHLRAI